mgnify:CR=1 FL=1
MTPEPPISVGVFDGFSWIRCEGKGSFLNSSILKSFADQRLAAGERSLVVDLSACTGMDSTFMGTLAGIAARLSALDEGGTLQIAEPGALIGFAGPRVVKETTHQNLPPGFQTAEFMLEHGLVDAIVHRGKLRERLATLLSYMMPR